MEYEWRSLFAVDIEGSEAVFLSVVMNFPGPESWPSELNIPYNTNAHIEEADRLIGSNKWNIRLDF